MEDEGDDQFEKLMGEGKPSVRAMGEEDKIFLGTSLVFNFFFLFANDVDLQKGNFDICFGNH